MPSDPTTRAEHLRLAQYIAGRCLGALKPDDPLPSSYRDAETQRRVRLLLNMAVPDLLQKDFAGRWEWVGVATAELPDLKVFREFVTLCIAHLRRLGDALFEELLPEQFDYYDDGFRKALGVAFGSLNFDRPLIEQLSGTPK